MLACPLKRFGPVFLSGSAAGKAPDGALETAGAARLMDTNKRWVTLASGCLLILVPWMQVSRAATSNIAVAPSSIAWVCIKAVAIHRQTARTSWADSCALCALVKLPCTPFRHAGNSLGPVAQATSSVP